jgi:hypothetical protein
MKPLGYDIIRYRHAVKAMDNIDEVDPQGVIISAKDFPRHWKIIVQLIRNERSRSACPIVLLKGKDFTREERSKAFYLGVNGVVSESLSSTLEIGRLQRILDRQVPEAEKRKEWLGFVFTHPVDGSIVSGEIKTITGEGLEFQPDRGLDPQDITAGQDLAECSLRLGNTIFSPICRVERTGIVLSLRFASLREEEWDKLNACLKSLPLYEKDYSKDIPPLEDEPG